jgi:hypothetical protein
MTVVTATACKTMLTRGARPKAFVQGMHEQWEKLEPVLAHLHAGIQGMQFLMLRAFAAAACHSPGRSGA